MINGRDVAYEAAKEGCFHMLLWSLLLALLAALVGAGIALMVQP